MSVPLTEEGADRILTAVMLVLFVIGCLGMAVLAVVEVLR